ncbi:MAG: sodium:calcium antiporter [Planctomycetota bacterium]
MADNMEDQLEHFFANQHAALLAVEIVALLAILGKAADWLVGEAVVLSERSGLPKVVIGATIVSLGTTAPETAVSVLAALNGKPELALGNAVGSVICDTGLILGLAALIRPLKMPRAIVNRQGWLQFAAGWLLVAGCWPWGSGISPFDEAGPGGNMPRWVGFVFLVLLIGYLALSVRWAKAGDGAPTELEEFETDVSAPMWYVLGKLFVAIALVVASSHVLIPAIEVAAERMGIPKGIVAATLVAFGTSLPELVTAITAARKDHGDLAIGNIIGADILNVLFVAGASAAVTPAGLTATPGFFRVLIPGMIVVLIVFRVGVSFSGERMQRPLGAILLLVYVAVMVASFTLLKQDSSGDDKAPNVSRAKSSATATNRLAVARVAKSPPTDGLSTVRLAQVDAFRTR